MSEAVISFNLVILWEEFSAGVAHPFAEPGILLAVCALACMMGQSWPAGSRATISFFALSTLAGVGAARLGFPSEAQDAGVLLVALVAALSAAIAPAAWPAGTAALAVAGGFLTGAASTPVLLPLRVSLPAVAGALAGAVLALALLIYTAGRFRQRFGGERGWIGLRIAAAWVAAIAMMMLALLFASAL